MPASLRGRSRSRLFFRALPLPPPLRSAPRVLRTAVLRRDGGVAPVGAGGDVDRFAKLAGTIDLRRELAVDDHDARDDDDERQTAADRERYTMNGIMAAIRRQDLLSWHIRPTDVFMTTLFPPRQHGFDCSPGTHRRAS